MPEMQEPEVPSIPEVDEESEATTTASEASTSVLNEDSGNATETGNASEIGNATVEPLIITGNQPLIITEDPASPEAEASTEEVIVTPEITTSNTVTSVSAPAADNEEKTVELTATSEDVNL